MSKDNFSEYVVFVDESGDHSLTSIDESYPVFVLCFCIIRKDVYIEKITPAIRHLKMETFGHDLVILHEHDIRKRKKDFNRLGPEDRQHLIEQLGSIIDAHEMTIVAVVIDKPAHKKKYAIPEHPYHLALMFGLERLHDFLLLNKQKNRLTHIIFEARGSKEDAELELEFRRVCDGQNRARTQLPFDIRIESKLTNSEGLQLADLTARPIGLSVIRPNQPNKAYEVVRGKFYRGRRNCVEGNGLKVFP